MACVSAVTASSYLPSVKARTPVSKYVWASWAASGMAHNSSTLQSNHNGIDRRIASSSTSQELGHRYGLLPLQGYRSHYRLSIFLLLRQCLSLPVPPAFSSEKNSH